MLRRASQTSEVYNRCMFPAIFLDRDGVLIENRANYIRAWSHVQIFSEAVRALAHPSIQNYKIVIVTNQSAVGRGLIDLETALSINKQLLNVIRQSGGRIDGVYICPHTPDAGCLCRKPKPGLLLRAASELNLDLFTSWMIGDAWTDVQAGQNAGVQHTILLKTGRGSQQLLQPHPENLATPLIFADLRQAFDHIRGADNET